jgi:two-component system, NarL family, response regulator LiaR
MYPYRPVKAVQYAYRGETQLHPEIAKKLMDELSLGPKKQTAEELTERELDVLRLIARGQSNREIARELIISEKTVKTHVSNILSKLHLADRTQAAIYALREGLATES